MQAIILAAGNGTRLGAIGAQIPKAMLKIDNTMIIDQTMRALINANINKVIIVINNKSIILKQYLLQNYNNIDFVFINESEYNPPQHNNIYSLSLTFDYMLDDDNIIIESDICLKDFIIKDLIHDINPNVAVLSPFYLYMNGTAALMDEDHRIIKLNNDKYILSKQKYKTVNVYKFSKQFCRDQYIPLLTQYMKHCDINSYYETPLYSDILSYDIYGHVIDSLDWYEIDTEQDYIIANMRFATGENKYKLFMEQYGGYWRIPEVLDCCYLTNAFFNKDKILNKMQQHYNDIINSYPYGDKIHNHYASLLYNLDVNNVLVGNGATELIQALSRVLKGSTYITLPTYNEYLEHFKSNITELTLEADNIIIVNPNNPTNKFYTYDQLIDLIEISHANKQTIIVDESFADFVSTDQRYSLLQNEILHKYPNLIVIKSLGKTYGINSLKLGILACGNIEIINKIKSELYAWNLNGFAEYFLHELIYYKYEHKKACDDLCNERESFVCALSKNGNIKILPSNTNFLTIQLLTTDAHKFCVDMLEQYNILIKDLSNKKGLENFIRVAINNHEDNNKVVEAFQKYFTTK